MPDGPNELNVVRDPDACRKCPQPSTLRAVADQGQSDRQTAPMQCRASLEEQRLSFALNETSHAQNLGLPSVALLWLRRTLGRLDAAVNDVDVAPPLLGSERHDLTTPEIADRHCKAS